MLALCRLRCLRPYVPASQTRYLRTQPREIPAHALTWRPTEHTAYVSLNLPESYPPRFEFRREAPEHGPPKSVADASSKNIDRQYHTQRIAIKPESRDPRIEKDINRLEYLLNLADSKDDVEWTLRAPLWKAYNLAKSHQAGLLKRIPQRAWKILWKSQYMNFSDMARRKARLTELDRDLVRVKATPFGGQVAYRMERVFMAGNEGKALNQWEESRNEFQTAPEYLDVGARLYALAGMPEQARAIMNGLFQLEPEWDLSVMLSVFRAHTSSESKQHHEEAKEIYHTIKTRVGANGSIDTYDCCLVGFLEARSLPDAKEVFLDMVREGYLGTKDCQWRVEGVLRRLHLLYALGTDISSMTSIALDTIAVLPAAYHGDIFGDWMKFAVVEQEPQAAAQILDMMIHRGYEPETFHFNMLLRALLRTDQAEYILKAENLGWKMIEEARLSMRKNRPAPRSRVKAIEQGLNVGSILDAKPTTAVPAASVSTFALIMNHHAQSSQWEHVDYLTRQLRLTGVEPNVAIMNVLIDNKCRQGKFVEAWRIYKSLTDDPDSTGSVFPNGESIRCLWKTLRIALADSANRENPDLPTPRELLRETINWWTLCRSRYDADRFLQGLAAADRGAITRLILHCFSYVQDLPGSLVALHVLRHKFDIYSTHKDADIVQRQVAWVNMDKEESGASTRFSLHHNHSKRTEQLRHLFGQLKEIRAVEAGVNKGYMAMNTMDTEMWRAEDRAELELDTISDFVRLVLQAKSTPELVESTINAAKEAVGVPELPTGDRTLLDQVLSANPHHVSTQSY